MEIYNGKEIEKFSRQKQEFARLTDDCFYEICKYLDNCDKTFKYEDSNFLMKVIDPYSDGQVVYNCNLKRISKIFETVSKDSGFFKELKNFDWYDEKFDTQDNLVKVSKFILNAYK